MKSKTLTKEYIIKELSDNVNYIKDSGTGMAVTSWGCCIGVLITGNMAEEIIKYLTKVKIDSDEN